MTLFDTVGGIDDSGGGTRCALFYTIGNVETGLLTFSLVDGWT